MMKWLDNIRARYRWSFVGTVEGVTLTVRDDGTYKPGADYRCYWNLYERGDGKRRWTQIGKNHGSPSSNFKEAQVRAWTRGGPVPSLHLQGPVQTTPTKRKAKLIAFPGGKDGGA